jgi:hypothetical protein
MDAFKTILLKKEATYGTDATPAADDNAVPTRNFDAEPVIVDQLDRKLDVPSRGRTKSANTKRRTGFSYELDLAGSGTAGDAAPFMEHLEMCGMAAPTLTADTDAVQAFAAASATLSSATCYHWMGEERVRALGCRGTFSMDWTAGAYPFARINAQGILPAKPTAPVDTTAIGATPDYDRWIDPLEICTENTDFTLGGYAALLRSFTFDVNAAVALRYLVGSTSIHRGNHALTGRLIIEAPALASKNYFTQLDAGSEAALQIVHGTVAGNILQLDMGQLQILRIARTIEDDTLMLDMQVAANIDAGEDDLVITAK